VLKAAGVILQADLPADLPIAADLHQAVQDHILPDLLLQGHQAEADLHLLPILQEVEDKTNKIWFNSTVHSLTGVQGWSFKK
jgi:hypothetical protein